LKERLRREITEAIAKLESYQSETIAKIRSTNMWPKAKLDEYETLAKLDIE